METAPEPAASAPGAGALAVTGLVGVALLAAAFAGDSSDVDGVLPVGGAAVVLLAATLFLFAIGRLALPCLGRSGRFLVGATVLLVVWTGLTVVWSIVPDRSWDAFNKSAVFAVFLGLGIVLAGAGGRAAARLGASMLAVVTAAVLAWALLAKIVPSLDPEGDRVARLREPVDYWNGLALIADMAIALALWLGVSSRLRPARIAGALLGYLATLVLLLTLSRAGVIAAVVVLAMWMWVSRERVEGGLLLATAVVPAALVVAWAFTRPALVEDGADRADRVADGAALGVLVLVGAAVVAAVVAVASRRDLAEQRRRHAARGLVAALAIAVAGAAVAVVVAVGNPVSWTRDQLSSSCSEVANDPGRLASLNPNNRWCWWNEAWDVFAANAPEGAGAGTFVVARKRYRVDARNVLEPHNVPLQQLADGGAVAFGLFLALIGGAAAVCVCAVSRLEGGERAAAVALVAAPAAYLVHALVDYDWDFLATSAPALAAAGVLAGAGRPTTAARTRLPLAVAGVLVGLALLVSFSFPRLAEREVRASTRALDDRDYESARDHARRARLFNPLAVEPVYAFARIAELRGQSEDALDRYVQAVELQPENPETWYALGFYEFTVAGNECAAYTFLNNAYTLDPSGSQWVQGGYLDRARDAVNSGACEP
jgi:hypothetical protein